MKLTTAMSNLVLLTSASVYGDRISFDTPARWQEWVMPGNAVAVSRADGVIPVHVRKKVNAILDATNFGGGVRDAGSNSGLASQLMDDNTATGFELSLSREIRSGGELVAPGSYILRISVDGDSRRQTIQRLVPVIY